MNWTERRPNGTTRLLARHPYGWSMFFGVVIAVVAGLAIHAQGLTACLIAAAVAFVLVFGIFGWYWGLSGRGEKWQGHFDATHQDRSSAPG